ncbi:MAG TPA: autotransporter domain-containing protein [Burkholderiales bacterium]|nr:autotransporter domain-containing protein [Burkholderiales bacterium]
MQRSDPRKPPYTTLAAACALALCATPAGAGDFAQSVYFGDSLTDAGTFGARFTTNPGAVWSQNLAVRLGTSAAPAVAGGSNYAVGGARVTSLPGIPASPPTDLATPITAQIDSYLASTASAASPGALYSVWGGANDIFFATGLGAGAPAYVVQTAGELAAQVARLQAAGARVIIVPNVPDIGTTPFGVSSGPAAAAALTQLSVAYNQALYGELASRGVRVVAVDTFGLLNEVIADPAAYGFVNASLPACGATPSLLCTPADLVAPGADQNFVFADGVHPTTGGHAVLTDYIASILAAPGQISMLPETAVATRLQQTDRLLGRLTYEPVAGRRLWVSADAHAVDLDTAGLAGSADATGAGAALGIDVPLGAGWTLGAALSFANPKTDWSNGGGYRQNETALSAYAGWRTESAYVNGVLTYSMLDYDIERGIRLGAATRTASGSTRGSGMLLGLEGGLRFSAGAVSHGPLAGVIVQQVQIDGFAEQGAGSANMRYGEQTRDSAIARLGWRVEIDAGAWHPHARLTVNQELQDDDRQVSAQLASATSLPLFTMPAAAPGRTTVSLLAGTTWQMTPAWQADFGIAYTAAQSHGSAGSAYATLSRNF